jgi:hypothetical protein
MGSGHFLVEATEFIARFLVDLDLTPEPGQGESDLAYWKRRVVQSCIYGVDLNPLAVDLAKLSLWLTTVAKDRPLSFLDHHLRAGNSLVGTRLTQVQAGATKRRRSPSRRQQAQVEAGQMALFADDAFRQRVSSAIGSMWQIEESLGETVADVRDQEAAYERLRDDLARRYGRLADLMTAREFGVTVEETLWKPLTDYTVGRAMVALPAFEGILQQVAALAEAHHFFHWDLEFPEVFFDRTGQPLGASAGFDAVIGNPPYVRQEQLSPLKPYFATHYSRIYAGTADLFVYFFGRGLELLQEGGRLSYISSNSWLRANYAQALRAFLRTETVVETLIDLGDNRVFTDAPDVYPAIHVVCRTKPSEAYQAHAATFNRGEGVDEFAQQLVRKLTPVTMHDQPDSGWQLNDAERTVFTRLMGVGTSLGDVVADRLYRGVLTGLNEAFIINDEVKALLLKQDPRSAEMIRPIVRGSDLRPWYQTFQGEWLILIPAGWTREHIGNGLEETSAWEQFRGHYPAIAAHLEPHREKAHARWDKGEYWWELRACDYYDAFEQPKIFWPELTKIPRFSWDEGGVYVNNKGYLLPTDQPWLLGILNSRTIWFVISKIALGLGERAGLERFQLFAQYTSRLPIPEPQPADQEVMGALVMSITAVARGRYTLHERVRRRILADLGQPGVMLNQKLTSWWDLDFPTFRAEVKKSLKREIPLRERDDWEGWLSEQRTQHQQQTTEIIRLETGLNTHVYTLFALSPAQIRIIEESTKYHYGAI